MKTLLRASSLAMMVLLLSALVAAADDGDDGGPKPFLKPTNTQQRKVEHKQIQINTWELVPEQEGSKMGGKVELNCFNDDKDTMRISFHGLNPHKTYTVWFLSSLKQDADRAGAGTEPFTFKASSHGKALYQVVLKSCPLVKYRWLEVRELEDTADPKQIESSVRVLKVHIISE